MHKTIAECLVDVDLTVDDCDCDQVENALHTESKSRHGYEGRRKRLDQGLIGRVLLLGRTT